jgi:hypothetical protein
MLGLFYNFRSRPICDKNMADKMAIDTVMRVGLYHSLLKATKENMGPDRRVHGKAELKL